MAAQLRKTRAQFEILDIEMGDELATLDDLIVSCEIHASRLGAGRVVVDRDRGDTRLKGCLANLAAEMLGLFGMVPRRLLAMIASVALDQKVTPAMAREACRWAVKEAERERLTTNC